MKAKMIIMLMIISIATVNSQDSVNLSGSLTFLTQTNSLFTGGRFSDKPALNLSFNVRYKEFSLNLKRNSDLLDSKSGANLFAFTPAYAKKIGQFQLFVATELDLFDATKELNLIAPYFLVGYTLPSVSLDFMGAYARIFSGSNIWVGRGSIGKSLSHGYSARAYVWAVEWNNLGFSLVGEISKKISDKMKVSAFYHLNNFTTDNHQEFGAIQLGYAF